MGLHFTIIKLRWYLPSRLLAESASSSPSTASWAPKSPITTPSLIELGLSYPSSTPGSSPTSISQPSSLSWLYWRLYGDCASLLTSGEREATRPKERTTAGLFSERGLTTSVSSLSSTSSSSPFTRMSCFCCSLFPRIMWPRLCPQKPPSLPLTIPTLCSSSSLWQWRR